MNSRLAILIILFMLFLGLSDSVEARVVFEDDFSSGLEKWQVVKGSPDIWQVNNGVLIGLINANYTQAMLVPKDEFWPDTLRSYKVEFDMLPVQGTDKNVVFAYETPLDWYELHFYAHGSELIKVENGIVVWQERRTYTLGSNGFWHHFELILNEGNITILKDDIELFNLTDPAYEGSYYKPGFRITTGAAAPTEIYFDNFVVNALDTTTISLPVSLFLQIDPLWGSSIYDSADLWADSTSIASWGCALTSAVMILQFHGFYQLPDNTYITPESLNSWLIEQPDGYLGQGLVNWLAITRLTFELSQKNSSYALVYRKHPPSLEQITNQFQQNNPVILQIPGHFLVGSGLTASGDIIIKDPAYVFTKLSEHNKELLSFRSFTPTNTDLSHLLITYNPELNLALTHQTASLNLEITEEFLTQADNPAITTAKLIALEVAGPPLGRYSISVLQADFGAAEFTLYAYDPSGGPHPLTAGLTAGPYPTQYSLHLDVNSQPTLRRLYSFTQLQSDLAQMKTSDDLYYWRTLFLLEEIVAYAAAVSAPADQLRYLTLIRSLLTQKETDFNPAAFTYLQENLDVLEAAIQETAV